MGPWPDLPWFPRDVCLEGVFTFFYPLGGFEYIEMQ